MRISFVTIFLLLAGLSSVQAATSPIQHKGLSDTELSQRLVGQWESKFEKKRTAPINQVFISLDSGKNFKLIRIGEFQGKRGRLEYEGKWGISNGELILEPSKARTLEGNEPFK